MLAVWETGSLENLIGCKVIRTKSVYNEFTKYHNLSFTSHVIEILEITSNNTIKYRFNILDGTIIDSMGKIYQDNHWMRVPDNWKLSRWGKISLHDPSLGYQLPKKYGSEPVKEIGNSGSPHEMIGAYAIRKSASLIDCSHTGESVFIVDVLSSGHIITLENGKHHILNFTYNDDQWIRTNGPVKINDHYHFCKMLINRELLECHKDPASFFSCIPRDLISCLQDTIYNDNSPEIYSHPF